MATLKRKPVRDYAVQDYAVQQQQLVKTKPVKVYGVQQQQQQMSKPVKDDAVQQQQQQMPQQQAYQNYQSVAGQKPEQDYAVNQQMQQQMPQQEQQASSAPTLSVAQAQQAYQQLAPYSPGQNVAQAQQAYQQLAGQKPADYVGQYQQQMQQLFGQIQDRKPFSYDLNADMLYQQYKDQYARMGKMAMQDTMGQAATLTGGYGNSYANTAGNQAYQGYLQRLNEMVPQLEDRAHARYQAEGQDLYNQYGLAAQADQMDYGRYRDSMSQWMAEQQMAYGQYRDEQGFDYGQYRDATGDSQWNRTFEYGQQRDAVGDQRYQGEMDYRDRRDAIGDQLNEQQQGNWQAQFDYGKQSDQQKQDFGLAMSAIQKGKVPSAELLARAGIDAETAKLLAGIYTPVMMDASSGRGSSKSDTKKTTFDPNAIINVYKEEGTARMDQELEKALRDKAIKPEEAAALRQFTMTNVPYPKHHMVYVAPDMSKINTKMPANYQQMLEESLSKLKK